MPEEHRNQLYRQESPHILVILHRCIHSSMVAAKRKIISKNNLNVCIFGWVCFAALSFWRVYVYIKLLFPYQEIFLCQEAQANTEKH